MTKLTRIKVEQENFVKASLPKFLEFSKKRARQLVGPVRWRGNLGSSIQSEQLSENHGRVFAGAEYAHKFEEGFIGRTQWSLNLQDWRKDKKIPRDKWTLGVNYKRSPAYQFMFRSIPNDADVKRNLDTAFYKNIKGGIIHG